MEPALCHRCGHENPPDAEKCVVCEHHLYVFCHCGERNLRANIFCSKCGRLLRVIHRSLTPMLPATASAGDPRDLWTALAVFAFLVLALLAPGLFKMALDAGEDAREELQRRHHEQSAYPTQQQPWARALVEQARERQRQSDPWRDWINSPSHR
jgi:hypothetical protein